MLAASPSCHDNVKKTTKCELLKNEESRFPTGWVSVYVFCCETDKQYLVGRIDSCSDTNKSAMGRCAKFLKTNRYSISKISYSYLNIFNQSLFFVIYIHLDSCLLLLYFSSMIIPGMFWKTLYLVLARTRWLWKNRIVWCAPCQHNIDSFMCT